MEGSEKVDQMMRPLSGKVPTDVYNRVYEAVTLLLPANAFTARNLIRALAEYLDQR